MLNLLTINELHERLAAREICSVDIVKACINRVKQVDPILHAFIELNEEVILSQAIAADREIAREGVSAHRPLLGIPIGFKDIIAVKGQPLRCASKILADFVSPYDATVTERLKQAGAIPFGRLNMDEFGMGSSTENSAFGPTRNPWDRDRTPGGSSGGLAAAIAADECIGGLGSDTGGSIRQPAAFCGCIGLKPTYGRVSRYGLVAYASSLDQIGTFTKDILDAALLLQVISGHDPRDSTSVHQPVPNYRAALNLDIKGVKVGLPKEYMMNGIHPDINHAIHRAVQDLAALGAEIVDISLPHTEYAIATYYIIATAEASANLARFDGIRYGSRVSGSDHIELYERTRGAGFGPEVKRRIMLGTYVLSSGYYDAYYLRAQKIRTLIRQDFLKAFERVDGIITPTTPSVAFKIGEKTEDPLQMYLSDIFTISCNLSGICGISVPCGFSQNPKLPIGLQLLGKPFCEEMILRIGHAYLQAHPWQKEKPLFTLE